MRRAALALAVPLLAAAAWSAASLPTFRAGESKVDALAWLAGSWRQVDGDGWVEEHWTKPAAGTLLGMNRTVSGSKTKFFEFLRIEERAGEVFYIAQPRGGEGTVFRQISGGEGEAVFENPKHDFPTRIAYRKEKVGGLHARVSGMQGDKERVEEWHWTREP